MSQQNIPQLLNLQEVVKVTRLSRATIYRLISDGEFPHSVRVSARRVAWKKTEIVSWFDEKVA